jgi:hypothetical protein
MARNVANDLCRVQSRGSQGGGVGQSVTRHSDACKNLNCLVPRCDDRDVSRHRARDHVESGVALNWAAGDSVFVRNVASGPDHLVAHCNSLGGDRALGIILLVAEVSAGCRVVVLLFRRHIRDDWLRGSSAAERVAFVRPPGGFDGHFAVWAVYCISIRHLEQNLRRPDENQPKLIHERLKKR